MGRSDRERAAEPGTGAPATGRQRLDKWLWFARIVKSRTLAAKLVAEGHVRINGLHADAPAKPVGAGDVLTVALEREVKVLRVLAGGARRGPYAEARLLYEDLSPPPPRAEGPFARRAPGAHRIPTRARRSLAAWLGRA